MPTYRYKCSKGHEFEAVEKITDDPRTCCIECKEKVERMITQTSFVLKGKGWAKDGYSNK